MARLKYRSDHQLMAQVKMGDRRAFEILFQRYKNLLINFFYRLCWNKEEAQDCLQEVFMRLWQSASRYEPKAKLVTYIFRIAKNYWLNEVAKRKVRPQAVSLSSVAQNGKKNLIEKIPSKAETPVEELARKQIELELKQAVEKLPEEQKLVFTLSEYEEMPYKEIAEILDCPVGTVSSRKVAAFRALRSNLRRLSEGSHKQK